MTEPLVRDEALAVELSELGQQLRVDAVRSSSAAGSGHPTSSMSAADLMAVLLTRHLRYDFADPRGPRNDHLIFSKGHASPLLYSVYKAVGVVQEDELINGYRRFGQRLQGHPAPVLPWVDVAYQRRAEAFGARVITIDGHSPSEIDAAFSAAKGAADSGQPTVIVAKTIKGRGYGEIENMDGWHGKALPPDMAERAIAGLGGVRNQVVRGPLPEPSAPGPVPAMPGTVAGSQAPSAAAGAAPLSYEVGQNVATRKAYGDALAMLGSRDDRVVALDSEVSNSTYAEVFARAFPDRYFEMFIAEQQMIASATGLAVRGYKPFTSTFAAFFTRAHDFFRMSAISGVNLRLAGSHAGVEIGADGPSQMALEDLAMMRAVHGSTVLYPATGPAPPRWWRRWPARRASATSAPPAAATRGFTQWGRSSR
ncbi:MAG: hypothetical protein ACRDN0_23705 [Trebonia sp.]